MTGTQKSSINAPRPEDIGSFWTRMTTKGGGPAKVSRFLIQIIPPSFPNKWKLNFPEVQERMRDLTFQCEAAELPGRNISTNDITLAGPTFKLPYGSNYGDITLNFICTNDMYERKLFDDWLNYINNTTNFLTSFREDYATSIYIFQYDEGGDRSREPSVTFGVELIEAYPVTINSMGLTWGDESVHKLGVTFAYTYYRPLASLAAPVRIPENVVNNGGGPLSAIQGAFSGFTDFLGRFI
jgi:hypothetical protein